jgi:hypothetical protein
MSAVLKFSVAFDLMETPNDTMQRVTFCMLRDYLGT